MRGTDPRHGWRSSATSDEGMKGSSQSIRENLPVSSDVVVSVPNFEIGLFIRCVLGALGYSCDVELPTYNQSWLLRKILEKTGPYQ